MILPASDLGVHSRAARCRRCRSSVTRFDCHSAEDRCTSSLKEPLQKPSPSDRDVMSSGVDWCTRVGAMKQLTLARVGFERYGKTTRRAVFLAEMERVVPWPALCGLIEPFYPKPGNGRPPIGVERMLRIYFLQHWFNLSDPAVEE